MADLTVNDLRPSEIETYLRSKDWTLRSEVDAGAVWISPSRGDADVFVPRHPEFADYARRILDLVRTLSELEERPGSAVVRDLVLVAADVIRFRLPSTAADQSIPLDDALQLFQKARDALRAAGWAASSTQPRAFYLTNPPQKVAIFLEQVRMGHTEPGSFVLPVISPLGTIEAGPAEVVDRSDPPFGRSVTRRFAESLGALSRSVAAAKVDDDLSPFRKSIKDGVSADLCYAVGAIAEVGRAHAPAEPASVAISFSWSTARPIDDASVPRSLVLSRADAAILQDAGQYLRSLSPRPMATITGRVVRLERRDDEAAGQVGIHGEIAGETRTVTVTLKPTDYARAIHAHELGVEVSCSGVLERSTHSRLEEPIEFIAPDTLFE
jgi:hypothetical protein